MDRRRIRLYRDGGSRKITLPKSWLRRMGMENADQGDLVLTKEGITLQPVNAGAQTLEDEPEFASFLAFLGTQALACPETLVDASQLHDTDADLVVR